MRAALPIARDALRFIRRSPFFWVWNLGVIFLVFSLNHLTFFDFEGGLVFELFITTLGLSGAVNCFVFHLHTVQEIRNRQWDLHLIRPIHRMEILIGKWVGLISFQMVVSLLLVGGYLLSALLLGRPASPSFGSTFWSDWYLSLLQFGMLAALYGLIGLSFGEFWSALLMVAAFLLGHLSDHVVSWLPPTLSFLGSFFFLIIPDLELGGPLGRGLAWSSCYSITYCIIVFYVSRSVLLRPLFR